MTCWNIKKQEDARRHQALVDLIRMTEELGLYEKELKEAGLYDEERQE